MKWYNPDFCVSLICQQLKLHQVKKADKGSDCPHFQCSVTTFSNMLIAPKYFFYILERDLLSEKKKILRMNYFFKESLVWKGYWHQWRQNIKVFLRYLRHQTVSLAHNGFTCTRLFSISTGLYNVNNHILIFFNTYWRPLILYYIIIHFLDFKPAKMSVLLMACIML